MESSPGVGTRRGPRSFGRWLVLGPSGAGKTTLSRRMASHLSLPLIHLDRHYWRPGWDPTPKDEWSRIVAALADGDAWIMDGNYSGTISRRVPRADAVVLLDMPPWRCLLRVIRRSLLGTPRSDLPAGCVDRRWDLEWYRWILTYRSRSRPKVLVSVEANPHVAFFALRSDREVDRFLRSLE